MDRSHILELASSDFNADLVGIDPQRIAEIAWPTGKDGGMAIDLPWCDASNSSGALEFLVTMGSLNFRFWKFNADGTLDRYKRGSKTGARALWAAFEENWDGNFAAFRGRLDGGIAGVHWLFGDIPYPEQRLKILENVFASDKLPGLCRELSAEITQSGRVTVAHANALARSFPLAFADPYLKKAQLVLSMHAGFMGGVGRNINASELVAFADYQVPRVLRALQILRYAPALAEKVDGGMLIEQDSADEKAIRSATILACEHIAQANGSSAADVDNWLWQAQDVAGDSRFHLTSTTRY